MLKMDQYGGRWRSELQGGKRELTLLRKRNPVTVCIRKFALHHHSAIPESICLSSLGVG